MTPFPKIIHVTQEKPDSTDPPWLEIHRDGVYDMENNGQPVAIYQRVRIGRVHIVKAFVTGRSRRRKANR